MNARGGWQKYQQNFYKAKFETIKCKRSLNISFIFCCLNFRLLEASFTLLLFSLYMWLIHSNFYFCYESRSIMFLRFIPIRTADRTFGELLENGSHNGLLGMLERNEAQVIMRSTFYLTRMNVVDYIMPTWKSTWAYPSKYMHNINNKWEIIHPSSCF